MQSQLEWVSDQTAQTLNFEFMPSSAARSYVPVTLADPQRVSTDFKPSMETSQQERLATALHILKTEFASFITLADIARRIGTNRTYLARLFRKGLGCTLVEVLTAIRMHAAVRHLEMSRHQICEIAWRVGYRSNAAFSRAFAARYGMSPRKYRNVIARD